MGFAQRKHLAAGVALLLALSCEPVPPHLSRNQEVYERALSALFREDVDVGRPRTVHVLRSSDSLARLPDSSYRGRSSDSSGPRMVWGDVPRQLRDSFHEMVSRSRSVAARDLPPHVQLGGGDESRGSLVSLSPVAFTADSNQALVYVGVHCGGLCGGADIVYLRRANAGWTIAATFPMWRS